MKKLVVLMLILTMAIATLGGIATVSAEGEPVTRELGRSFLDMTKLNVPLYEDINYYINIKSPSMFASYDKVLAVIQGNDLLVKIDTHIETIKDAKHILSDGVDCRLKSITIDSKSENFGYIYLSYVKGLATYETVIYEYQSSKITKIGTFSDYLARRNITADPDLVTSLDTSASDICYNNNAIYVIVGKTGDICKIGNDSISILDIDEDGKSSLSTSKKFTVSNNEDILIYGVKDRGDKIFKKPAGSTTFQEVASHPGLIDMTAKGDYVYLLTEDALTVKRINAMSLEDAVYTFPFKSKCLAFNVSTIGGVNHLSFALTGNDNILTYKEVIKDGNIDLSFYNHYGANCTCETPHQGWLNSPTEIVPSQDESTVYIVDNDGGRLVATTRNEIGKRYVQHYYPISTLNLRDNISKIATDSKNVLYIASGDKIFTYRNTGKYDEALPFTREMEIAGFDSKIVDMEMMSDSESTIYVLTSNGSLYTLSEGSQNPKLVASLGNDIRAISPSLTGDKIYVATNNSISSYYIDSIDTSKPLTTLLLDSAIKDFAVDYKGDIFALTGNRLLHYERTSDISYRLINNFVSKNMWQDVSGMYIHPNSTHAYFVDHALHISEKLSTTNWGYSGATDKYNDTNAYDDTLKYVAKTIKPTLIYNDPTNYEVGRKASEGEYFYVLAVDKNNKDMFLVVDKDNNFRYIPKDALAKVSATTNCIYGNTLVPLRGTANIYDMPFANSKSEPKDTITGEMSLIDNVAYEDGLYVWQNDTTKWFKVSYKTADNITIIGYVQMSEVSSATSVVAPETKIHLRVKTKAVETVALYNAPDLASGILLGGIKNGTLVRLAEDKFDANRQFTRVEIESEGKKYTGYILTEHLQENTFTTQQILAIVLSVITVLITILVIILVVQYKKKQNKINSFKDEE